MKKFIIAIIIISMLFFACKEDNNNLEAGEKVYKKVSVNNETVSKLLVVSSITEYDSNGNEIHYKDIRLDNGLWIVKEKWRKYDSKGNKIHYKYIYSMPNKISSKSSHAEVGHEEEAWWEYDNNGNEIHYKDSTGIERWTEYDSTGNKIYYKTNSVKQFINLKDDESDMDDESNMYKVIEMPWFGYDEQWYEYTFWENGKIKKCITYEAK